MEKEYKGKTVVLLSGGQDSTTALLQALDEGFLAHAVIIDYGQKHSVEISKAIEICKEIAVDFTVVNVSRILSVLNTALTNDSIDVSEVGDNGLPKTFVPNRNHLFILIADMIAQSKGFDSVTIGVSAVDYSGYPDCRPEFIDAMSKALYEGNLKERKIRTPLIKLSKAETFKLADDLFELDFILENTHTCYNGDRLHRNIWGYGCGECPACKLREKGFYEFLLMKEKDETV